MFNSLPSPHGLKERQENPREQQERRLRYDMTETIKIIHGDTHVNKATWFTHVNSNSQILTRLSAHPLSFNQRTSHLDIKKHFFSNRVVDHWNNLPDELKSAKTISSFISNYNKYVEQRPIWIFEDDEMTTVTWLWSKRTSKDKPTSITSKYKLQTLDLSQ